LSRLLPLLSCINGAGRWSAVLLVLRALLVALTRSRAPMARRACAPGRTDQVRRHCSSVRDHRSTWSGVSPKLRASAPESGECWWTGHARTSATWSVVLG